MNTEKKTVHNIPLILVSAIFLFYTCNWLLLEGQKRSEYRYQHHVQSPKQACGVIGAKDIKFIISTSNKIASYYVINCPNGNKYHINTYSDCSETSSIFLFSTIDDYSSIAENKKNFGFNIKCSRIEE